MNLVIDCFKQVKGAGKSIGIYNLAKSIVVHLGQRALKKAEENADRGGNKAVDTIIVLGNVYNREEFDVPGVVFVEVKGNPLNKLYCILWELIFVIKYARKYQADRILFPRGYRPIGRKGWIGRCRGGRKIRDTILIHDLIPFYYDKYYPGVFNRLENAYIMYRLKVSMKKADRIITLSEDSREDILDKVPGCGGKIRVIYNGMNPVPQERQNSNAGAGCEKEGYIVAMTSMLPHKNARGVLRAYEAYYKKADEPLRLSVIGIGDTSCYKEMEKEAAAHVTCYKFIKDFDEMCRIAAGARAYLFLSYVEGFGFPPLEAMQMGVPVVCSDRSSLPEVVGDAGILVDPDDMGQIVRALIKVTEDEAVREGLIQKGYENIRRFSWESRTDLYWDALA